MWYQGSPIVLILSFIALEHWAMTRGYLNFSYSWFYKLNNNIHLNIEVFTNTTVMSSLIIASYIILNSEFQDDEFPELYKWFFKLYELLLSKYSLYFSKTLFQDSSRKYVPWITIIPLPVLSLLLLSFVWAVSSYITYCIQIATAWELHECNVWPVPFIVHHSRNRYQISRVSCNSVAISKKCVFQSDA